MSKQPSKPPKKFPSHVPVEKPDTDSNFVQRLLPTPGPEGVSLGYLSRRWVILWPFLVAGVILYLILGR